MGRWIYTLKRGADLRRAVYAEDRDAVLNTLVDAYHELWEAGIIGEDDCDEWSQEIRDLQDDIYNGDYDDPDEAVDYQLDQFWDLCDNLGVWVPLETDIQESTQVAGASSVEGDVAWRARVIKGLQKLIEDLGGDPEVSKQSGLFYEICDMISEAAEHKEDM